jgi:hypothetical protein
VFRPESEKEIRDRRDQEGSGRRGTGRRGTGQIRRKVKEDENGIEIVDAKSRSSEAGEAAG